MLFTCLLSITVGWASGLPQAPSGPGHVCTKTGVTSTPMEAALYELRRRFPNQIVIGFEEFFYENRPECEPQIDLGPPDITLSQALQRVRQTDRRYRVELLQGRLIHVYPAYGTADPPKLLDVKLSEFFLPPDACVAQQFLYMNSLMAFFSYTPDLSKYLYRQEEAWYSSHNKQVPGIVGDFMGDCAPNEHRRPPFYHNITVREALNLMALRSLQVARGESPSNAPDYVQVTAISWKYRFHPEPDADTGIGGVPVFQAF